MSAFSLEKFMAKKIKKTISVFIFLNTHIRITLKINN